MSTSKGFLVEGILDEDDLERLAIRLLVEPVVQRDHCTCWIKRIGVATDWDSGVRFAQGRGH
ncbi:MAG: hypothetical protein R3C03_02830 [Pirellulaceae bacterium]